jgi:hypothetical protein
MANLPIELQDKIFLHLSWEELERTRGLQSPYVKKCTEFNNMADAIKSGNLENVKWLKNAGVPLIMKSFEYLPYSNNSENTAFLLEIIDFLLGSDTSDTEKLDTDTSDTDSLDLDMSNLDIQ